MIRNLYIKYYIENNKTLESI